jgi:hypothetical protein
MILGTRRAYENGDGGRWMLFHLEERDGEDQPGSMDRISEKRKKEKLCQDTKLNCKKGLKYLV